MAESTYDPAGKEVWDMEKCLEGGDDTEFQQRIPDVVIMERKENLENLTCFQSVSNQIK